MPDVVGEEIRGWRKWDLMALPTVPICALIPSATSPAAEPDHDDSALLNVTSVHANVRVVPVMLSVRTILADPFGDVAPVGVPLTLA